MSTQSRQPKGLPVGGQFAASVRGEATVACLNPDPDVNQVRADELRIGDQVELAPGEYGTVTSLDGDGDVSIEFDHDPTTIAIYDPDEHFVIIREQAEDPGETLHEAADSFASQINNAGPGTQAAFLRRHGVSDEEILAALDEEPDHIEGALDDLVYDVCSDASSRASNSGTTDASQVTDALDRRWLTAGTKTLVEKDPAALKAGEATDVTFTIDGAPVTYRVCYNEWVPEADSGLPAHGYLRGEFSAESEWAAHDGTYAEQSAPFRDNSVSKAAAMPYAWSMFAERLRGAATRSVRTKQRTDAVYRRVRAEEDRLARAALDRSRQAYGS